MRNKAKDQDQEQEQTTDYRGFGAIAECGDPTTDDDGLCEWHRGRHQQWKLALEMVDEAQRQLGRIAVDGIPRRRGGVHTLVRALKRPIDGFGSAVERIVTRGRCADPDLRRTIAAVLRSAEMKRLIRSQPRSAGEPPGWLWPGRSHEMAARATMVAAAVRALPDRPLHPQQVVDEIRELQVVRDPNSWLDADLFDRMLRHLNARSAEG